MLGILLRFREHEVAIVGDIKDMFLRVKILPTDQDALRFLWRENSNKPVKTYKMTSLIFGASCAPFVAQFIKNKNAKRYDSTKPDAVQAIHKQHYMDDYIDSQPSENTCIKLANDITYIHKQGGFEIRNWLSNSANVLNCLPEESLAPAAATVKLGTRHEGERALGIIWNPNEDSLGFVTTFKRIPQGIINGTKCPTKRDLLKVIMSLFDIYGFLSPFTINGKILLQETWKSNIDWDENITEDIRVKWIKWLKLLKTINNIRIPRCYRRVNESALRNTVLSDNRDDKQVCASFNSNKHTYGPTF
ncbi:uncharacterized protein LOC115446067 [Manduca sexta]|uniref:uncharacterized protein LOC115446067 n=1 Tax=Manduca sexta TaxID=7130 RepID=UPI00188EF51F|nr:uncharacterized protein LOC115446067 [Manduca sexta]